MLKHKKFPLEKKKYLVVMILCFLYGGFAILTTLFFVYNSAIRPEFTPETFFQQRFPERFPDQNVLATDSNFFADDENRYERFFREPPSPIRLVSSPILLIFLTSGVIALIAGITIWSLMREKEIKKIREETANHLLLPDEKAVIDSLKKSDYESTQAKLAKETGLNKVQVHRAVKRLESKGVLEKHNYGLTNKIILKKEFFE